MHQLLNTVLTVPKKQLVDPATLTSLPGEPGQPDFAWCDVQSGAVAFTYQGERFYMNANWRNYENTGNQFGQVSNIARIHDTAATVDRAAEIMLPHDSATVQSDGNLSGALGQGWVVRYGFYLIAGNNSPNSLTVNLPSGSGEAQELLSHSAYSLGASVTLAPGQAAIFALPGAGAAPYTPPANFFADGLYTLANVGSGLLADDKSGGKGNATPIDQAAADGTSKQVWQLTNLGGNYVRFVNLNANLTMDVLGGSLNPGATLDLWPLNGGYNPIWRLAPLGGGAYTLTSA